MIIFCFDIVGLFCLGCILFMFGSTTPSSNMKVSLSDNEIYLLLQAISTTNRFLKLSTLVIV